MRTLRCAIYTRVSTEHGLEQEFNSLENQREASEAYVKSQAHEGWRALSARYDDGGFSGASIDRPALQRLLADIRAGLVDVVVVYKVDRLTRSLSDFAKLVELFDQNGVSFVSVTQAFNTTFCASWMPPPRPGASRSPASRSRTSCRRPILPAPWRGR
jgi:site-specific DNA recombinase